MKNKIFIYSYLISHNNLNIVIKYYYGINQFIIIFFNYLKYL